MTSWAVPSLELAGLYSAVQPSDMSEQQPLLPAAANHDRCDSLEAQAHDLRSKSTYQRARIRTAEVLESTPLHYTVISLVSIPCNS